MSVITAEGLGMKGAGEAGGELHPVQAAFRREHGLQCGFCTPGMVMAATALLAENPHPTEAQVREGLEGNLCRCTGYHNIIRAVLAAAEAGAGTHPPGRRPGGKWPRGRLRGGPVIPAPFEYIAAQSPAHALDLLGEHGDDAKVLAGGHSLLPMMKLRLAAPEVLIDIGRLTELSGITSENGELVIGATTRHADLAASALVRERAPLLAHAAGLVGDPQIRHRGTIGGSLAHADPAADLPMALVALGGSVELSGPGGTRTVTADDFFTGLLRDRAGARRAAHRGARAEPAGPALGIPEVRPAGQRLGHRRRGRGRRPHRAGQHGPGAAAGHGRRAGPGRRGQRGRGGRAGRRGHLARRGHPRRPGLPPAPGPGPHPPRPQPPDLTRPGRSGTQRGATRGAGVAECDSRIRAGPGAAAMT